MKRVLLGVFGLMIGVMLILLVGYGAYRHFGGKKSGVDPGPAAVQRIDEDVRTTEVIARLRAASRAGTVAIVHVNLVDPVAGSIAPGQTVIVRGEKIGWVGPAAQARGLAGATVVDGAGRYLSPGLTDMHVHTGRLGEHVLRLAVGVTSVRDMDGFPWLLQTRDAIGSGAMIGSTLYVAGTIIADHPFFGYAVVVKTPEQARQMVRNQAQCGYSFIKVHNSLAAPLFDAVADEARRAKLDLVGHVPHHISLMHAIKSGHMRTIEHLKGFLLDQNLEPSDEPYAPALAGAEVWLTPSLYTRTTGVHGEEALDLATDPRQRFAPRSEREAWLAQVPSEGSKEAKLHDRLIATQKTVMARLLPLHPRWLVGTDAAGYVFDLAGFATLDELALLRQAGLSNAQIVRAATSEPAVAMRVPDEYGRIVPGMRADLVLLAANPLDDIGAYNANLGVVARGRWYDRASLDAALEALSQIYSAPVWRKIDLAGVQALADAARKSARAGFVFEDMALDAAAQALDEKGARPAAEALRKLVSAPATGVCAEILQ